MPKTLGLCAGVGLNGAEAYIDNTSLYVNANGATYVNLSFIYLAE